MGQDVTLNIIKVIHKDYDLRKQWADILFENKYKIYHPKLNSYISYTEEIEPISETINSFNQKINQYGRTNTDIWVDDKYATYLSINKINDLLFSESFDMTLPSSNSHRKTFSSIMQSNYQNNQEKLFFFIDYLDYTWFEMIYIEEIIYNHIEKYEKKLVTQQSYSAETIHLFKFWEDENTNINKVWKNFLENKSLEITSSELEEINTKWENRENFSHSIKFDNYKVDYNIKWISDFTSYESFKLRSIPKEQKTDLILRVQDDFMEYEHKLLFMLDSSETFGITPIDFFKIMKEENDKQQKIYDEKNK